ncbi:MAG TPA: hypothetical protein PK263_04035 [bacterium]|nr:hypothetical protein [bacterium]
MLFEQAYYTSCETGLRGSAGFQMNAASRGLDTMTLSFLERYGGYAPPLYLPTRPTDEERQAFPKALAFYRLPNGSAVISRSVYLGTDYSGRYGNFFTHFLVAKESAALVGLITPVTEWNAPYWAEKSVDETVLEPLELTVSAGTITLEHVLSFLHNNNRLAHLSSFAASVQSALESKRRIILVDNDEAIALWIASVSMLLPSPLLQQFTFTTYIKNPYNIDTLVCGTTADSDFGFSAIEMQHQYYVFDFQNGRFSVPPAETPFALKVSSWYQNKLSMVCRQFKAFADWLPGNWEAKDLDRLVNLFTLTANAELSEAELLDTLKFVIEKQLYEVPEILIPATAALTERDINDQFGYDIAKSLFVKTSSSPRANDEQKEDIARFYIDYFIEKILPQATRSTISDTATIFKDNQVPKQYWLKSIPTLRTAIEKNKDFGWLSSIVEFAKSTGILDEVAGTIDKAGVSLAVSNLEKDEARALLGLLIDEGILPNFDNIVYDLIHKNIGTPSLLIQILNYLTRQNFRSQVEKLAATSQDKTLLIMLKALDISSSTFKGERAVGFLKEMEAFLEETTAIKTLDAFFNVAWQSRKIEPPDAIPFFKKIPDLVARNKTFIQFTIDGLLKAPDIISPEERSATLQLINMLEKGEASFEVIVPNTPDFAEIVRKYKTLRYLATLRFQIESAKSADKQVALIREAHNMIPRENVTARSKIIEIALFSFFREYYEPQEGARLLEGLSDIDATQLLNSLRSALFKLNQKKGLPASLWIPLFRFVSSQKEDPTNSMLANEISGKQLRRIYNSIPNSETRRIDSAFARDKIWSKRWENWKKDSSFLGQLLHKITGH